MSSSRPNERRTPSSEAVHAFAASRRNAGGSCGALAARSSKEWQFSDDSLLCCTMALGLALGARRTVPRITHVILVSVPRARPRGVSRRCEQRDGARIARGL